MHSITLSQIHKNINKLMNQIEHENILFKTKNT